VVPTTKKTEKLEVRVPSELKSAFRQHCEAAGLTASEALRAFVEGQATLQSAAPIQLADNATSRSAHTESLRFSLGETFDAARKGLARAMVTLTLLVGCLLLALFVAIATLKPLWSDHVGLFRMADGTLSAGIVADPSGGQELLGLWSMPIALGVAALLLLGLVRFRGRSAGQSLMLQSQ
jgi:antitoxin component of RelBE/YafQ-DinJ toxin-antitoxin module